MPKRKNLVQRRPAESGTLVAGAAVGLLVFFIPALIPATPHLLVLVAAIPSAITYLVEKFK